MVPSPSVPGFHGTNGERISSSLDSVIGSSPRSTFPSAVSHVYERASAWQSGAGLDPEESLGARRPSLRSLALSMRPGRSASGAQGFASAWREHSLRSGDVVPHAGERSCRWPSARWSRRQPATTRLGFGRGRAPSACRCPCPTADTRRVVLCAVFASVRPHRAAWRTQR